MVPCRSCGEGIPENSRFCPQCGASLVAETMVTRTAAVSSPAAMLPSRTPSPSGSLDEGRFLPGTLLVDRYRVVLHRDLKPSNIMLDGRGNVLITDFGLAGLTAQIQGAEVRNGTPAYVAPEQLAGKEVSFQSDIYALGLVLYEIFTGKRAFEGAS